MKKPTKPPTDKELQAMIKDEQRYRRLKQLETHQDQVSEKMHEIHTELIERGEAFQIIPLCYQDSDVILAVCEEIGVTLIPIKPLEGTLFLDEHQFQQLQTAMALFITPTE